MRGPHYVRYVMPTVSTTNRSFNQVAAVDFVGPVCESGDWLGKDRSVILPEEGEFFAVMDAGAYCTAMASNYNLRARPAEVMVEGEGARLIQRRERYEDVAGRIKECSDLPDTWLDLGA